MDFKLGTHNGRLLHWPNYSCVSRKTKLWQLLLQPAVCMPSLIVQWSPEFATFSHCVRCETGLYIVMLKGDVLASEAWLPKHFTITRKPSVGKQSQSFVYNDLEGRKVRQDHVHSLTCVCVCRTTRKQSQQSTGVRTVEERKSGKRPERGWPETETRWQSVHVTPTLYTWRECRLQYMLTQL